MEPPAFALALEKSCWEEQAGGPDMKLISASLSSLFVCELSLGQRNH